MVVEHEKTEDLGHNAVRALEKPSHLILTVATRYPRHRAEYSGSTETIHQRICWGPSSYRPLDRLAFLPPAFLSFVTVEDPLQSLDISRGVSVLTGFLQETGPALQIAHQGA